MTQSTGFYDYYQRAACPQVARFTDCSRKFRRNQFAFNMQRNRILILGAAGRDFHNFNTVYRDFAEFEVVGFTATQIPDIDDRTYPAVLAGPLYPDGIPIYNEESLEKIIRDLDVDECVFSYSDVSYQYVMALAARVQSAGASFTMLGPNATMIRSARPVIAVCAVRTGSGKSPTSRKILELLQQYDVRTVVIRHPMPYGNIAHQKVQRFETVEDLRTEECTIEEMEEYEPYVSRGNVIYAGADYEAIIQVAEQDSRGCDLVLWDGGNNDFPFYLPDLQITLVDPHRAGDELTYYPGEVNLRRADVVIIPKVDTAPEAGLRKVRENIEQLAPGAQVVEAALSIRADDPEMIRGKRVLVVEDGPTLTHGGMKTGAGTIAAQRNGAAELVDPRPFLVGKLRKTFETYPEIGVLLPAMGYDEQQLKDLEATINGTDCDAVVIGTPIDLGRLIRIDHPVTRVSYAFEDRGGVTLESVIEKFLQKKQLIGSAGKAAMM